MSSLTAGKLVTSDAGTVFIPSSNLFFGGFFSVHHMKSITIGFEFLTSRQREVLYKHLGVPV